MLWILTTGSILSFQSLRRDRLRAGFNVQRHNSTSSSRVKARKVWTFYMPTHKEAAIEATVEVLLETRTTMMVNRIFQISTELHLTCEIHVQKPRQRVVNRDINQGETRQAIAGIKRRQSQRSSAKLNQNLSRICLHWRVTVSSSKPSYRRS